MDPNQLSDNQNQLLSKLEIVKKELAKNPNVLAVGIGVKETNNNFTNEISFRVFVTEKKDKSLLSEKDLIPTQIENIKTDILTPYVVSDRPGVCGDERRTLSKHRPLQAGIAISTDSNSYGTLGWFGALDADDTPILLTNKHVLYDTTSEIRTDKLKTAQPQLGEVSKCCCCECGSDNVIGESIIGIKDTATLTSTSVDCAIAKINTEFATDISLTITNDSTSEVLTVTGTAAAVVGQTVRKVGARSGFTTGTVVHIGDTAVAGTDPLSNPITIKTGQVLVIPVPEETYQVDDSGNCKLAFSNNGDSGSVILNADNKIVALLYGGDETTNSVDITFANNINNVLSALSANSFTISLSSSPSLRSGRSDLINLTRTIQPKLTNQLENIRNLNKQSLLYNLYDKHFKEVLDLVNHCRPVTLIWQRKQGPAFVAALGRAAKVLEYTIPLEINDCTRSELLGSMHQVLIENGSTQLQEDLTQFGPKLIECILQGINIDDFAEALLVAGFIDQLPEMSNVIMS